MKVAIIGAGIGGLALAALLAADGHQIEIFDQFDSPRPVGSGLVIQPIGLAVLDLCGAGEAARASGQRIARMLGHEAQHARRILDLRYDRLDRPEAQGLAIHRASLHAALLAAVAGRGIHITTSADVTAAPLVADQRRVVLRSGESLGPFDLVVDASGAGSALSPLKARALPYGAIWGTVPWPKDSALPRDQLTQRYLRAAKMAGVLPLGRVPGLEGLQTAVFWSMPVEKLGQWASVPLEVWKSEAKALWPEFAPFLQGITQTAQMTPARYSHGALARPFAPALAYIGDAAHRASPQLGQGANMALLDALALQRALMRAPLDEALPLYAQMRRWHVRLYQLISAAFTPQYQSGSRVLPTLRDHILAPATFVPPFPAILRQLVSGQLIPPLAGVDFSAKQP
jgi:2-polyprenyl-6-methoxyphenol hydroxylase-like FAD-dependent oxidoreductase